MNTSTSAPVAPARRTAHQGRSIAALRPRSRRALALLAAALLGAGPAACGGSSRPSAAALVGDTFSSHRPIRSGRVELSFGLMLPGADGYSLHLEGPFQSAGGGRFPRFALALQLLSAARSTSAGVLSTGGHLYLELGGSWFLAPPSATRALEAGYAQVGKGTLLARQQGHAGLGIEPAAWLTHPKTVGTTGVTGETTTHIVAALDVARFLQDAARLSSAGALLGPPSRLLTPENIGALARSVRSARVDLYIGERDHLLRGLAIGARLAPSSAAHSAQGAGSPRLLTFALRFGGLNQPQSILAPAHAGPSAQLARALERLGLARGPQPRA